MQKGALATGEFERASRTGRGLEAECASDQQRAQQMFAQIQSETTLLATQEQECQVEQVDAEAQFRTEEGKMHDLQDRLDRLDKVLASYGQK